MVLVPAGSFIMGTGEGKPEDGPPHRVELPAFYIDKTEVTIAQFARYARATGTTTRAEREGGGFEYVGGWQRRAGWTWQRPDGSPPDTDQLPAVHLTHAEAYCDFISDFLTENRAAKVGPKL